MGADNRNLGERTEKKEQVTLVSPPDQDATILLHVCGWSLGVNMHQGSCSRGGASFDVNA